jgi:hypothetical protein
MGICLKCNGSGFKHNGKVCKCKIYKYWFMKYGFLLIILLIINMADVHSQRKSV